MQLRDGPRATPQALLDSGHTRTGPSPRQPGAQGKRRGQRVWMRRAWGTRVCLVQEEVGDPPGRGKGQLGNTAVEAGSCCPLSNREAPRSHSAAGASLRSRHGGNFCSAHSHTEAGTLPCWVPQGSGPLPWTRPGFCQGHNSRPLSPVLSRSHARGLGAFAGLLRESPSPGG